MHVVMIMSNRGEETGSWSDAGGGEPAAAAPERWEIDPARSVLRFKLRHLVMLQIQGRFQRWGGTVFIDREQPWRSSVEVWIDLAGITTDDAERDAHVRSPEFLDVARFPRAAFKSTAVDVHDPDVFVEGTLSLHGAVREVRISAGRITGAADNRTRTTYKARGTIDRQAFGLHWNQDLDIGGIVLGDQVELEAEVEVIRSDEP
jgi:polyisoprenoid-binding protein YceI